MWMTFPLPVREKLGVHLEDSGHGSMNNKKGNTE